MEILQVGLVNVCRFISWFDGWLVHLYIYR